ncbi:DUF3332 domain-containing protein [Robertkochia flava]|uniref:DUF3332 domain-containing protein n=1 Tax=Robertkochia flava TaxID=3447986 RepID=UPI001CCA7838|nr:DUF3332 domain-containing protein [Robertkochia marina]
MKKSIICIALASSIMFSSCLGSFSAFNGLKDWNMEISDSKFLNNLVFWALWLLPVYEIFLIGDVIIFNTLEFWTGNNPVAMKEGEKEVQVVENDGNTIKMTATMNRMQIEVIQGPKKGEKVDLVYRPHERSWNAIKPNGEIIPLSSFRDGFYIVHTPDGKEVKIDANATREEGLAILNQYKEEHLQNSMLAEAE